MAQKRIVSYLRTLRKRSKLSQRELACLLGLDDEGSVSRHERGITVPPLRIALSYELIFRVPTSELFPSFYEIVEQEIEAQLELFEAVLGEKSSKDGNAAATALKLQFLATRKNLGPKNHT